MPKGEPEETCGDYGGRHKDGSECGRASGWGTDFDSGKCRKHRGTAPDGSTDGHGAPDPQENAVHHGLYAEANYYYREKMSDTEQRLCDQIFQDYCTEYRQRHGEPHTGDQTQLFEIAVNHIKVIDADNWLVGKPEELESGHAMVDKEQKYNTEGVPYQEYQPSTLLKAQDKLSNRNRKWLKDKGLLKSPEQQQADAMGDIAQLWESDLRD